MLAMIVMDGPQMDNNYTLHLMHAATPTSWSWMEAHAQGVEMIFGIPISLQPHPQKWVTIPFLQILMVNSIAHQMVTAWLFLETPPNLAQLQNAVTQIFVVSRVGWLSAWLGDFTLKLGCLVLHLLHCLVIGTPRMGRNV